ncbi:MAG: glycosyltransferase family 2 protein [Candidatus Magnetomorum sp.]|nr:glycosyltransferase family 2 protein [Candidatus Magnetomorum sp.]
MTITKQIHSKKGACNKHQYSIIIPTYNSKTTLIKLLNSILATERHERFEIIVVDDASTDQTYQAISGYPIRTIRSSTNRGSAYARNTGALAAQSSCLIFFDADIVVQPDTLDRLIACIDGQPENHVYMGVYSDTPVQKNLISEYKAMLDAYHWKNIKNHQVTSFEPRCAIMRKSLFEKAGGFDDTIAGADVEDYELGYRLLDLKTRLFVNPEIQVDHHFPTSFHQLFSTMFHRTQSWMQLFKHRKKFDNVASTLESALACGIAGLSGCLLPAIGIDYRAFLGFFCMVSLFIFLFSDFFLYIFDKKNFGTGIKMTVLHYTICMLVFWGAMIGLFGRTRKEAFEA